MAEKIISQADLDMDALSLMDFLNGTIGENDEIVICPVSDDQGRVFSHVRLVHQTDEDGSEGFCLVLS
ncbi:hypothetical protein [Rhizobium leguminosarum]|uniref:hypothetical protein n=1 Tax=Rhizobium leguminosarum TaxID=384 RepID=UPI002E0EFB14|nr:hypothetical protein U8Q02_42205 [Rhizobium leguminosarum]